MSKERWWRCSHVMPQEGRPLGTWPGTIPLTLCPFSSVVGSSFNPSADSSPSAPFFLSKLPTCLTSLLNLSEFDSSLPSLPSQERTHLSSFTSSLFLGGDYGTHIDSPAHFYQGKSSIEKLPLRSLVSPFVMIEVEDKVKENVDYALSVEDILRWEEKYGTIPNNSVVCMRTGWSSKIHDTSAYRNMDSNGVMHFPGFSKEAAEFLVFNRTINAVGIDTLSLDPGTNPNFDCHSVMLSNDKYQIENMKLDQDLPPHGGIIISFPLLMPSPECCTRVLVVAKS